MVRRCFGLLLAAFASLLAACTTTASSPDDGRTEGEPFDGVSIPGQAMTFQPTRDDITVKSGLFSLSCARRATAEEEEATGQTAQKCYDFVVNDAEPEQSRHYIDLIPLAKNELELEPLKIDFSTERQGHLCMSVKVFFEQVGNEYDSLYYEDVDDRYALVSYCTSDQDYDWATSTNARFSQNRVATLEKFVATLSEPFVIRLNDRPLPGE